MKAIMLCCILCGVAGVQAFATAVYLVPWDYDGPQSKYYEKWGGPKPHCTLAGFDAQPFNLDHILSDIAADTRKHGRWRFDCTNDHCTTKTSGQLILMTFYSRTVTNILSAMNKAGVQAVKTAQPYHITLCERSEKKFSTAAAITALNQATDWRLVVAIEVAPNVYYWLEKTYAV